MLDGRHVTDHARLTPAGRPDLPAVSSLAVEAASEAVGQAGWDPSRPTAVVACTSKGPVEEWTAPAGGRSDLRHGFGMATLAAAVAASLSLGDGPRLTVSAACAGGLQALARGVLLLRAGDADRVLIVAAEASVLPMFVASFARLGVLPPAGELCRPFDVDRQGFLMSEAAAAVCLERPTTAARPLVAVDRFAVGGDASHLTGIDRDGVTLRRLVSGVCGGGPFDLVHAHGTGTEMNDAAEVAALTTALPDGGAAATLFSHKAALGHTLGASGLVSVVLSCLAHGHGCVPPNVNTRWAMPMAMRLSPAVVRRPVDRSLVCAAGFGGGAAVVTLRSADA